MDKKTICLLCMKNKELIQAHIIPKPFYAPSSYLISDELPYRLKRPIGTYDPNILCGICDNYILGKFDCFAKQTLLDRQGVIQRTVSNQIYPPQFYCFYQLKDKAGYDKLTRFFISVFWRASISTHKDFSSFSLGEYEQLAKRAIVDEKFDFHQFFSVSLCLLNDLKSPINFTTSNYTLINGVQFYIFIIGYFKVFFRCDSKKALGIFDEIHLSAKNDILMLEGNLNSFPEHQMMKELINRI